MNVFDYKVLNEEYIKSLELKVKNRYFKLMFFILKVLIIVIVLIEFISFILNIFHFDKSTLLGILTIILGFNILNKKNLKTIKLLKYNRLKKTNKLERKIVWDNNEFKFYNNKKLIINSYSEIKNLIENDKFFIINYEEKYKKNFNIIVPKKELYKKNLLNEFKNSIINKIGENNYKNLDIKLEKYYPNKREYIIAWSTLILIVIIILININMIYTL